jgi:hypothetical protein
VAQNVAKPLVKYIDKTLVTEQAKAPKITLLVGHDSNIASCSPPSISNRISCTTSTSAPRLAARLSSSAGMTKTPTGADEN